MLESLYKKFVGLDRENFAFFLFKFSKFRPGMLESQSRNPCTKNSLASNGGPMKILHFFCSNFGIPESESAFKIPESESAFKISLADEFLNILFRFLLVFALGEI